MKRKRGLREGERRGRERENGERKRRKREKEEEERRTEGERKRERVVGATRRQHAQVAVSWFRALQGRLECGLVALGYKFIHRCLQVTIDTDVHSIPNP